jgi:hypothetical protein
MSWTMNNKAPLIFPTLLLVKSNVCVCVYIDTHRDPLLIIFHILLSIFVFQNHLAFIVSL